MIVKKFNCSINGEALFCKLKFDQVAIDFLIKDKILYIWSLNSLH